MHCGKQIDTTIGLWSREILKYFGISTTVLIKALKNLQYSVKTKYTEINMQIFKIKFDQLIGSVKNFKFDINK